MFSFDAIATLALATLVLLLGQLVKNRIAFLSRYNLPAPVIGGLLAATALAIAKQQGWQISFDSSLRTPMMLAFFTTLGFAASLQLLKIGGRFVFIFLAISSLAAILQNVVGASAAVMNRRAWLVPKPLPLQQRCAALLWVALWEGQLGHY